MNDKKGPSPIFDLSIIIIIALAARFLFLGKQSLWMDEAYTVWCTAHPISIILQMLHSDQHPPFFYLFTHLWMVGGHGEFFLRIPSALWGTATAVTLYFFGGNLFSRRIGFWTALLWASAFIALEHETQVRMYAMATMFSTLSSFYFWKSFKSGNRLDWLLYFLSAGLAIYTHYYCGFVLLAQILFLLSFGSFRKAIQITVVLTLLFLPQLPIFLAQYGHHLSHQLPTVSFSQLFIFAANGLGLENVLIEWKWLSIALGAAAFIVIAGGVLKLPKEKRLPAEFLLFVFLIPSVVPFLISKFTPNHIFIFRYVILFVPYFFLLFVAGLSSLLKNYYRVVLILFVGINLGLWYLFMAGPSFERQDWRDAAMTLRHSLQPGDFVFVEQPMGMYPLWYYLSDRFTLEWLPASPTNQEPLIRAKPAENFYTSWLGIADAELLPALTPASKRHWLVLCQSPLVDPHQRALSWFLHHEEPVNAYQFRSFRPGNEIFIYEFERRAEQRKTNAGGAFNAVNENRSI